MKYYQQLDITDCGAACLAMIASHFGQNLNIAEVREKAGTDNIGTNLNGLLIAAKKYGFKVFAAKGTEGAISPNIHTPFIAHIHIMRDDNTWVDHYVVVKKITKKSIEIWDPDPLRSIKKRKFLTNSSLNSGPATPFFLNLTLALKNRTKKKTCFLNLSPYLCRTKNCLRFRLWHLFCCWCSGLSLLSIINIFLTK